MSQTNSVLMSIITQHTKQFVDRISELENENNQLKHRVGSVPSTIKADFDSLSARHAELKSSYEEIERENTKLRQHMEQLIAQQKSLEADISQYFAQTFSNIQIQKQFQQANGNYSTPVKSAKSNNIEIPQVAPSQKPIYREAKATTKLLNTEYDSDSEFDSSDSADSDNECLPSRKLRFSEELKQDPNKTFIGLNTTTNTNTNCSVNTSPTQTRGNSNTLNLSSILSNEQDESDDEHNDYESILKHIITEGLMSGLENMNKSPYATNPRENKNSQSNSFCSRQATRMRKRDRMESPKPMNQNAPTVPTPCAPTNAHAQTNTNAHPFSFAYRPESTGEFSNRNGNSHGNSNQTPTAQEVQLVTKILESLFYPQGK